MTAATVVCCNMISLSQTWYGSAVRPGSARQGRQRRWRSYQARRSRAGKMADDDTHPGMTKAPWPVHGPRPIAAVVPAVVRTAFNRVSPGIAQLMESWSGMVGPALAEVTVPRRLMQGTLTIGCSGPVAMELQHLATELIGRINQYLGSPAVRHLRFLQTATAASPSRPNPRPSEAVK